METPGISYSRIREYPACGPYKAQEITWCGSAKALGLS